MRRSLLICVLAASLSGVFGCAMCASPFDCEYPGYGGITPRESRFRGRVGSLFHDAGAGMYVEGDAIEGQIVETLPGDLIESPGMPEVSDEMEPSPAEDSFDTEESIDSDLDSLDDLPEAMDAEDGFDFVLPDENDPI